jgi:hypothetical protein
MIALLAACGGLRPASAQQTRVGLWAGRAVDAAGTSQSAVTLAPSFGWAAPRGSVALGGELTFFQGRQLLGSGQATGRATLAHAGPLALVLDGSASAQGATTGYRAVAGGVQPQLRLAGARWSVEGGPLVALGRDLTARASTALSDFPLTPSPATASAARTNTELGWSAAARVDGPVAGAAGSWRGMTLAHRSWDEWTAQAAVVAAPLVLSASVGARTGDLQERWGAGRVTVKVGGRAALLGEVGRSPSNPMIERAGGRYAALGLIVRPTGR